MTLNSTPRPQSFRPIGHDSICRCKNKRDPKLVLEKTDNAVGKGENSRYQQFLLLPQWFQKSPFTWSLKSWDCVVMD